MIHVAVTGANGFIGSQVVRAFLRRGHAVTALVRPDSDRRRIVDLPGSCMWVEGELASEDTLDALLTPRPDALVHLAWYTHPKSYRHSTHNLAALDATSRLFMRCSDVQVPRVVGVGTCLEYAETDRVRRPGDRIAPDTLYGATKHAAHTVGAALATRAGTSFLWARIFHLFGPGEDPRWLVPNVLSALTEGRRIKLTSGVQIRDWMHVRDIGDAIAALALSDTEGACNVCSGAPRTLRDFLESIGNVIGRADLLGFGDRERASSDPDRVVGDPVALHRIGWTPNWSFDESLADLVGAWREGRVA